MRRHLFLFFFSWLALYGRAITVTDTIFDRQAYEDSFAFGADVSFVPMMESWGTKWLDKNGRQKDILQILKEQGINSIRLRVWTVSSGASSKQEVVSMCKRAKAKGMSVMIDFHYSDTWADPGSQTIPAAWTDHSVDALAKHVYDHTYDVLSAIKAAGVVPRWVQVGNETKRGMLYPVGQTNKGGSVAFAKFVLNGYNAVKAVDSTMQVIVHLPDGHDNSLYRSIFDGLKKNGAKWDIIGLSAYPRWSHLDGPTMITRVMSNITDLKSRYGKPCMVVETGHYPREALVGNQYLVGLMDRMLKNGDMTGCFYWEPESMGGYDMGAWDETTKMPTIMMDAFLGIKHTQVSWLMKAEMQKPAAQQTLAEHEEVLLAADVKHVRNRVSAVDFYFDKTHVGTVTSAPYECGAGQAEIGVHTAWAKAADSDGNVQATDTVAFYVGQWGALGAPLTQDATQKGGTARWGVSLAAAGRYRLVFDHYSTSLHGAELWVDTDSLSRIFFLRSNRMHSLDVSFSSPGFHELRLRATSTSGLPAISELLVFPLDGQAVPEASGLSAIRCQEPAGAGSVVSVYTLSGVFVGYLSADELGVDLSERPSAVVRLPYIVGGTPYIVRKQRLK